MIHHPHVHGIVPGGGLSINGDRWVDCKPGFFLPVKVLSRLFRRLFLEKPSEAYHAGALQFFGEHQVLAETRNFNAWLKPLRQCEWVVYAKRPFAGPTAVLAYLSRYTHRVAIANSRLIAFDERGVTFKYKDYRHKGKTRYKSMTLATDEFMRRFLIHVLPSGFHRIRHYGFIANTKRKDNLERARKLLVTKQPEIPTVAVTHSDEIKGEANGNASTRSTYVCPKCEAPMDIIDTFLGGHLPRAPPLRMT